MEEDTVPGTLPRKNMWQSIMQLTVLTRHDTTVRGHETVGSIDTTVAVL